MVESVKGMPAASAARAARISPSPCSMPHSPIGASAIGAAAGSPMILVEMIAIVDVHQHALAQLDGREIVEVGVEGLLGVRAAVGVFEKGARNPPAGKLAQVFDAGCDFHGCSRDLTVG